jgi:DNA polymerase III subunit chi
MVEIGFYHLTRSTLGEALPRLLERALGAGHRILVKAPNPAEVERLNKLLWTYGEASFLPHGSAEDGWAAEQPIYLTADDDNPNGAGLGCQCGGAELASIGSFTRILDLFDGSDEDAVAAARDRWRRYKAAGHSLTYWQQNPNGGWAERKA